MVISKLSSGLGSHKPEIKPAFLRNGLVHSTSLIYIDLLEDYSQTYQQFCTHSCISLLLSGHAYFYLEKKKKRNNKRNHSVLASWSCISNWSMKNSEAMLKIYSVVQHNVWGSGSSPNSKWFHKLYPVHSSAGCTKDRIAALMSFMPWFLHSLVL